MYTLAVFKSILIKHIFQYLTATNIWHEASALKSIVVRN